LGWTVLQISPFIIAWHCLTLIMGQAKFLTEVEPDKTWSFGEGKVFALRGPRKMVGLSKKNENVLLSEAKHLIII
jgi:hypothetical protein